MERYYNEVIFYRILEKYPYFNLSNRNKDTKL